MPMDNARVRAQFPALQQSAIFLDNPGGTQICNQSLERIQKYLIESNANHGGAFPTSRVSDATVDQAHQAMADLLNAYRPEEIIFGQNMTTLTFHISRSLAHLCRPGDTLVVTRLDHDGNISPWLKIAEDGGLKVRWVDFDVETGALDLNDFQAALAEKPRIVAVGYASNALGTINPVADLVKMAHAAGALVYVDAVQYAPHGPIDVQDLDCDFLICSAYKFFGPHIGILYGKYELLDSLPAYKVRPAPQSLPGRFMTGTQSFEGISGVLGAIEYLEWIGNTFGQEFENSLNDKYSGRRLALKKGLRTIQNTEFDYSRQILSALQAIPGVHIYGNTDPNQVDRRVPTFSFTVAGHQPKEIAEKLGEAGIYVWDGNYYALAVTERLGLEGKGGMVRVGAVHYNNPMEIQKFGETLHQIIA